MLILKIIAKLKQLTMSNNIEKRYTLSTENKGREYRVKANSGSTDERSIRGYGVVFGQKSKIITEYVQDKNEYRTFNEIISPLAFDNILKNIANYDIILNVNHEFSEVLARTASQTLKISKDVKGLIYETQLPLTSRGTDILEMVKRGDYYESSFQFIVADGGDSWVLDNETGIYVRTINNIEILIDMCIATYRGCYSNTSIEVGQGRIEFNEYKNEDIQVAALRLKELIKSDEAKIKDEVKTDTIFLELPNPNPEAIIKIDDNTNEFLTELELDKDKFKVL
jgi:HK97 family phage prohead protease